MSLEDDGPGRPIRQPMGSWSWPPDLFAFGNWRRLQELGLKSITIEDEYYISELPRKWTAAERKYALIIRDRLTHRFDRKLLEWLKDQSNERLTEEVINLEQKLSMKWSFSIDIPRVVMDNLEEALSRIERGHIIRPWRPIFANPQAVRDLRKTFPHLVRDPKTGGIIITGYETGLIYCPPPLIPIAFNPTMLTLHDADRVMKTTWNIVKSEIKKLQGEKRQGWTPVSPSGEPEELAEVLRCRPVSFEKYLWWYDLHMKWRLPFRLIAYYESAIENPERLGTILDKVIDAEKKPKIRRKVQSESMVRKGHDIIHFAIHRGESLDDEDENQLSEPLNCPNHGDNCPLDCEYLVKWWKDRTKQFKDSCPQEIPHDPATLEALLHKKSITE